MRTAEISRKTNETDISIYLNIDGTGKYDIDTGCGFLNHMLELFAKHGRFDLTVRATGDTEVDYHHLTEDTAIVLGQCFKNALGDKRGIARYGDIILPMDEALILCAVDISGRAYLVMDLSVPANKVGDFDTELVHEFMYSFAVNSGLNLHLKKLCGDNSHHIIEGAFKALARSISKACVIIEAQKNEVPSTKGSL